MKFTKFTAALMVFSIAVSGFAASPARADEEDVAKIIGGLLTLYVIGKAIENAAETPAPKHKPAPVHKPQKPKPPRHAFVIPSQCVMSTKARHGASRLVAFERCLDRERTTKAPLPRACETTVRTRHGRANAYDVGCLTDFGYRVRNGQRARHN